MKKFVSILLVAMLIISLFPATAMPAKAATYEAATSIAAGDTVVIAYTASKKELSTSFSGSGTKTYNPGVTYTGNVPAGEAPLTVEDGSSSGTFALKMADGKYLSWSSGNYLQTSTTKNANSSWKISFSGSNVIILNASDNTRKLQWNNSSPRFACYTSVQKDIQLFKLPSSGSTDPDVPACDHVGYDTYEGDDGVAGSCTVDKVTATVYCSNCDGVVTEAVTTPAPGHAWEGESCSVCGAEKPNGYVKVDNVSTLSETDKVVITMTNSAGTYALTNGGGTSSAPKATAVTVKDGVIENLGTNATNLVWNVKYDGGNITIYPDGTTATWLYCTGTNNGVRVGTNAAKVFTISGNYLKHTGTSRFVGIYNSQDWRCYTTNTGTSNIANQTLAFYKLDDGSSSAPTCDHQGYETYLGDDGKSASCTEDGATASVFCSNCNGKITASTVLPATGHNYVDGECTVCHAADPFVSLPGTYYIATKRTEGNYWYMTSVVNDRNRYVAEEATATLPEEIEEAELDKIFQIISNGNGTYSIQAVGVEGNNYLGWTSDNTGILVAATAANTKFTPEYNEQNNTYQFHFTGSDGERYLSLNGTDGNDYFAWYKGTQKHDLSLIPAEIPAAEPVINGYVDSQWVGFASIEAALNATNTLQLIAEETDDIICQGDLILDLNGYEVTATAGKIYAYDSSATSTAAGTGMLTTTSDVEFDYTANTKRYIALNDGDSNYTFHVLEMKLSGVSLRTTAAGIYYKAKVICDSTLMGEITNYGVLLSTKGVPTTFDDELNAWTNIATETTPLVSGTEFTSGSVFGIFKDGKDNATRGTIEIYANAYIALGDQILMTNVHAEYCMQDVVSAVNNMNFDTMAQNNPALYQALGDFYNDWVDVMDAWNMDKLYAEFGRS